MATIKKGKDGISVRVSVFVYKDTDYPDGDMFIAYCPELDLTGYDTTCAKAKKSFECVLKNYLAYTTENGTLEADLKSHGWRKYKSGKIVEPSYNRMLRHTQLKSVLSQQKFNKYSIPFTV